MYFDESTQNVFIWNNMHNKIMNVYYVNCINSHCTKTVYVLNPLKISLLLSN